MKILLANPSYKQSISRRYERYYIRSGSRWPHSGVKMKGQIPHYLPFPFFLAYAAALLKEADFDVYVIDAVALDISEVNFLNRIYKIKPDIVFYEIEFPTFNYDLILAKKIKRLINTTIVVAGTYATAYAAQILSKNIAVDFVLKGEYELSLLKLLKVLRERISDFPRGVTSRNNGKIVDRGYSNPVDSLDELPYPLRDIFPSNDKPNPAIYWDGFCQKYPAIQMQSSRNCFYNCYFCLWKNVIYQGNGFRTFSIPRVVNEMQELIIKYKVREIYFDDDDFTADKKRIFSLCQEILERNIKTKWSCMGNVVNLTKDIIEIMAESGCIGIKFGIESGSEKILSTIGKPVDLKKIKDIVKICNRYGVKTHATFTIGHRGETRQDIEKTLQLVKTLAVDSIQVSTIIPYPGTKFYSEMEKNVLVKSQNYLNRDNLNEIRKKIILTWLLKRLLSFLWFIKHLRIILRTITGWGVFFFFKQCKNIIIDEYKNKTFQ